ncbi:ABC transporter substrate-binding protein [Streptomyces sp. NPDC048387]|uniref:ABC transporter substrate-binding protein n=1 Tax=unclassified Streptomyces TaxID=2593676 RepID=UPI003400EF8A
MTASTTRRTTAARSRIAAVGAIAVAGALILTGCGDQTDKSSTGSGTGDSSAPLFSKLPKKVQDAGVIKVGSDTAYAPMEFVQDGKIVGVDPDIAEALGKQLGVKLQFTSGTFDGLITSLETGRQDVAISSITDNKKRQEGLDDKGQKIGKGVDFVDYMSSGVSLLVKKGNPDNIKSLDDLCGKTVAVQRGTIYEDTFKAQADKCGADKKLTIEAFDTDAEAQTRVKAGGAVADLNDFPVTAYIAKNSGGGNDFEVGGQQSDVGLFGIAVSKDNTQLRDALKEAVDAIIKDGSYAKVLEKWNVKDGAVQSATINAGK